MSRPSFGICDSVLDAIGDTPLIDLRRLVPANTGRILAKLELQNPGGSKKDRAALRIITEARESGQLLPGQPIVEMTSGNMGAGLAVVAAVLGHPFHAVMSRGNSPERAAMMSALGAHVHLVEQSPGAQPGEVGRGDVELVRRESVHIADQVGAFFVDQFNRPGNSNGHYFGTAAEIWQQTEGKFDAFCDFVGSGGSFAGCARYFNERNPSIKTYIVEPEGAAVLACGLAVKPDHPIQGGGYAMTELPLLDGVKPDGFLTVSGNQARATARQLARQEGIFAGFSAGANIAAAQSLLAGPLRGATIVVLLCDTGLKYLSTDLWPKIGAGGQPAAPEPSASCDARRT